MRFAAIALAGAMALWPAAASAVANVETDDFQFADVITANGLLSFDVSTTTHTGDAAGITLVEWTNPDQRSAGPAKAAATVEAVLTFDCVQKTDRIMSIITRNAAGNIIDDNDTPTAPSPVAGTQSLMAVSLRLACSKGNKIGNIPVYTGRAAAEDYAAKFFRRMNPPVLAPPSSSTH
jgi:hypothetical protein